MKKQTTLVLVAGGIGAWLLYQQYQASLRKTAALAALAAQAQPAASPLQTPVAQLVSP